MPRDSSGNYTLPEPAVVTGSTILAAPYNSTLSDIAAALTDSLSRTGSGGLSVARFESGTDSAPGIAWVDEIGLGFRRASAANMAVCMGGAEMFRWRSPDFVEVYRGGAWHNLIDASSGQTFTGNVTFDASVFISSTATVSIANDRKIQVQEVGGTYRDILYLSAADMFTVGDIALAAKITANGFSIDSDTALLSDSNLTLQNGGAIRFENTSGTARNALRSSGGTTEAILVGNADFSDLTLQGLNSVTVDGANLRLKESIVALDSVPGYQNFLTGVQTDNWTVGDIAIDLTITGSDVTVTPQLTLTAGAYLPNNVAIQAASVGFGTADLLKLTATNAAVLGADYLTIDGTTATFSGQTLRLPNNKDIQWENQAGGSFIDGIKVNTADKIIIGGDTTELSIYGDSITRRNVNTTTNREVGYRDWRYDESRSSDTSFDIDILDEKTVIFMDYTVATQTANIPTNALVPLPIGTEIRFVKTTAGPGNVFTVQEKVAATVTINGQPLASSTASYGGQGFVVTIIKTGTDTWYSMVSHSSQYSTVL
tara:strand:- start:1857 stop:3482 length:1626 start_codon:yes stop_codon:yes gene_type:complete